MEEKQAGKGQGIHPASAVIYDYNTQTGELGYQITKTTTDEAGNTAAANGIVFENVKYPDTITVNPEGFKYSYTGNEENPGTIPDDSALAFSFLVLDSSGKEVGSGVSTANPAKDGNNHPVPNITFTGLTFGNQDVGNTYTYTIKEAHSGTVNGITHDPARYTMTVVITRENSQLQANVSYTNAVAPVDKPSFTNYYHAEGYEGK